MSRPQAERFLRGGGDEWLEFNRPTLGKRSRDLVTHLLDEGNIQPTSILEVGCANGWRLKRLKQKYNCLIRGIDPSEKAIAEARIDTDKYEYQVGIAQHLPWVDNCFDVVIYGFCWFVFDPNDYFRIMAEGNRVLRDGGFVALYDFISPRNFKRKWEEYSDDKQDTFMYFSDFSKLWLAHPCYTMTGETNQLNTVGFESAALMQKGMGNPACFPIGDTVKEEDL